MKKVLLLQSRPEKEASDGEFESFCQLGGIDPRRVRRVRMDQGDLPEIILADYVAVLMGGGPANLAYDDEHTSDMQRSFEPWLMQLCERIVETDTPFLGVCLGFGAMAKLLGGTVSFDYGEEIMQTTIRLTDAGRHDPLLAGIPDEFAAFVGHKEGVLAVPEGATELAVSTACSQMLRIGQHVYATQFHPELDVPNLVARIRVYQHHGYFHPDEMEDLISRVSLADVTVPERILRHFAERYIQ